MRHCSQSAPVLVDTIGQHHDKLVSDTIVEHLQTSIERQCTALAYVIASPDEKAKDPPGLFEVYLVLSCI
ncbi:hypothetical protein E6H13_09785 [Candidatus Bathyarchaeota archaeon]|nr:MAG: hypothetical protein E6H13_09785 [Candidatus Bathyarchaeota archaeon]